MQTRLLVDASKTNNYRRIFVYASAFFAGFVCLIYILLQNTPNIIVIESLPRWTKVEDRIRRPIYVNEDHGFCGPCPTDKQISTAWQIKDLIEHIRPKNSFLINIGAASTGGGRYDPTYPLLIASNSSFGALLIDPNPNPLLFNAYPQRNNILITHDYIWPESIIEDIFVKYKIHQDFALLKLDIDSYECTVLESILRAEYRPNLIHIEFNPIFPPPIIFMPKYNSETKNDWRPPLWSNVGPFYGCSLSALSKLLFTFNYILLQVEFWDAIYIEEHIARTTSIQTPANDHLAYTEGFLGHSCFPYCQNNQKLYNEKIDKTIKIFRNQSNFKTEMISIIDLYASKSIKTGLPHPYVFEV